MLSVIAYEDPATGEPRHVCPSPSERRVLRAFDREDGEACAAGDPIPRKLPAAELLLRIAAGEIEGDQAFLARIRKRDVPAEARNVRFLEDPPA